MRLIDASRTTFRIEEIPILTDKNQSFYEGCRYMQKRVLRIFHTARTVDAVEVVRCKDCIHYDMRSKESGYCYFWDHEQGMEPNRVVFDDFCSYGERKEADGNG